MNLTARELELIRIASSKNYNEKEIKSMSKKELLDLTDNLGSLIGYDPITEDIDAMGLEADNVISKILVFLEKRGEMKD